jgi:hypothetical protein
MHAKYIPDVIDIPAGDRHDPVVNPASVREKTVHAILLSRRKPPHRRPRPDRAIFLRFNLPAESARHLRRILKKNGTPKIHSSEMPIHLFFLLFTAALP